MGEVRLESLRVDLAVREDLRHLLIFDRIEEMVIDFINYCLFINLVCIGLIDNSLIEGWDDGDNSSGDGCSKDWKIEFGWNWNRIPPTSPDVWTEKWGDGIRFNSVGTYWDDNNTADGDGCSSTWSLETGWIWSGGSKTDKDICEEIWGDGIRFNSQTSYWDDGNLINGDGWSKNCTTEACFSWTGGSSNSIDVCSNIWGSTIAWGNGFTQPDLYEMCDDGNNNSGDGCSNIWVIEKGYLWQILIDLHYLSYWRLSCGNGKIETGEEWDDGNSQNGDGWSSLCKIEFPYVWK